MYYVSEKMNQKQKRKTKMINENQKQKTKMINEKSKQKKESLFFKTFHSIK